MPASRVRVFEATDIAKNIARTFKDRDVETERALDFGWPDVIQEVGESLGVAYDSDKWKPRDTSGRRDSEVYKHIAESRNRIYAEPGLIRPPENLGLPIETIGPKLSLKKASQSGAIVMPKDFAELGRFMEANVVLHTGGTSARPELPKRGDKGVVTLSVKHGMLGASKMKRHGKLQPFLFVYHPEHGVYFIITGDELDIEKDGIVG